MLDALVRRDALSARRWIADATRSKLDWMHVAAARLGPAASCGRRRVVETIAARQGVLPAAWTAAVPAAQERFFLVRAAELPPRLRRLCEVEGPEALRSGILARPELLTAA
jgi:hypothetical protein